MKIQRQSQILRSHLLRIAMLSHRAVDYSIKAYELGNPEFSRLVRNSEHEWHTVQHRIGERNGMLQNSGVPVDSDSLSATSTLRIYSALRLTHAAATEIARNSVLIAEGGHTLGSQQIRPMGRFVNSLVRLYTVALFKREIKHVQDILQNDQGWKRFALALSLKRKSLFQPTGAQDRIELAIAESMGQIADQAYEIAKTFTACLDSEDCLGTLRERAA